MGLIERLIPASVKRRMETSFQAAMRDRNRRNNAAVPKTQLGDEHVRNTRMLKDRVRLLEELPKGGVVAELGVNKGEFSALILEICKPEKLHLVDMWGNKRYHEGLHLEVKDKFAEELAKGQVVINHGMSTTVVDEFEDGYFDWAYIDTDHTYKTTLEELQKYAPKVKTGGILAGHDYLVGNWNSMFKYGVIEAVYEFCVKENWEIIYVTAEIGEHPSFAIRKIA